MNEIWKDVLGYEGLYQVSNLGRVKSLPKKWVSGKGLVRSHKGKILIQTKNSRGYFCVNLYRNGKCKSFNIHKLVANSFIMGNYRSKGFVVDHINDNKEDNRLINLQVVTQRYNSCKTQGKYSSLYKGVSFCNERKKWLAQIQINGRRVFLGRFDNEIEASIAYQNKIKEIDNGK